MVIPESYETALRMPLRIGNLHHGKLTDHANCCSRDHECVILAVWNSDTPEKAVYQSLFGRKAYFYENRPSAGVGLWR